MGKESPLRLRPPAPGSPAPVMSRRIRGSRRDCLLQVARSLSGRTAGRDQFVRLRLILPRVARLAEHPRSCGGSTASELGLAGTHTNYYPMLPFPVRDSAWRGRGRGTRKGDGQLGEGGGGGGASKRWGLATQRGFGVFSFSSTSLMTPKSRS